MSSAPPKHGPSLRPSHRQVLAIAVPIMVSNVSTPLIGMVDTGVVGQVGDAALIGAVAVGALIFTFMFWAFGFLRMGTTGLTAQALGAGDDGEVRHTLGRALVIAMVAGAMLVVLQWPIREVAFWLLDGSARVEELAGRYFDARVWSAPAALTNYALLGWFIGRGRARVALVLQLVLNLTNMGLDALFVLEFGWGVEGVAWGTVVAEVFAAAVGLVIAYAHLRGLAGRLDLAALLDRARLGTTLAINRDIMVRSLALLFVFVFFMAEGARRGDVILAANAILMHFISGASYFLDGLAFATEALVGRAIGAGNRGAFRGAVRISTGWAAAAAVVVSIMLWAFGPPFIDLLTVDAASRETAREFLPWAASAPLAGVWCFQLDGVFIGATRGPEMRNAMVVSTLIFVGAWWLLLPLGNHGLWAALFVHYAARTATLGAYYPRIAAALR